MRARVRVPRWLMLVAGIYALACVIAGIALAEMSLRLHKLPLGDVSGYRGRMPQMFHAEVEDVAITAADGAVLRAWFVQPPQGNGKAVVVLHGVTANRVGSAGFSQMFLQRGYAVLMPDSRAHGISGGEIATYGVLESDDVRRWVDWVRGRAPGCTYLLGESMGGGRGVAGIGCHSGSVCGRGGVALLHLSRDQL